MHLVLNKKVYEWDKRREESTTKDLSIVYRLWIRRAECETSNGPRQSRDKVGYHENVMPIMVIGGRHVGPASASQGSEDAHSGNKLWQSRTWPCCQDVPQAY